MAQPTFQYIVQSLGLSQTIKYRKSFNSPKLGEVTYSTTDNEETYSFEDGRYKVSVTSRLNPEDFKHRIRVEKKKRDWTDTEKKVLGAKAEFEGRRGALFEY